jgi:hypothetical protein
LKPRSRTARLLELSLPRLTNYTKLLINNPVNFLIVPLSEILPIDFPLT